MVDEGSQFRRMFADLDTLHDIMVEKSDVEVDHGLSIRVGYKNFFRNAYAKLKLDYTSMKRLLFLALAVKSMKKTLRPEGIVPSVLVFVVFRSLISLSRPRVPRQSLAERAEAAQYASRYVSQNCAKMKFK